VFRLLSRRIVLISLITVTACTILIGLFSFQWAKRTVEAEFMGVSSSYFAKSNDLIVQYMNNMEEKARVILDNPVIAREIREPRVSREVQPVLDHFSQSLDVKLLGISIYKPDGTLYSLSRMSSIPTYEQLKEDAPVRDLLNRPSASSAWTLRNRNLAQYSVNFNRENGALTYLAKSYDDRGGLLGLMVIDLDVGTLFDFLGTTNKLFRQSQLFLIRDNEEGVYAAYAADRSAPGAADLRKIKRDPEGAFISADGSRLVLYQPILGADAKIAMSIPLKNIDGNLRTLRLSIVLYTVLFGLLAVALAILLRRSIVRPLSQLYKRIRAFV